MNGSADDERREEQPETPAPEPEPEAEGTREAEAAREPESKPESEAQPEPEPEPAAGQEQPREITVEELMAAMREVKIGTFLLQTMSTLAQLAYAKLEVRDLEEARAAIDAIGAIVPVLEGRVEEQPRKDFERALANLRLAYASAAAKKDEPESKS